MRVIKVAELLSSIGVVAAAFCVFYFIFGDAWGKSVGLAITAGVVTAVTQLGMRRVRERRHAHEPVGLRARVFVGIGAVLIALKVGLDLGGTGPSGVRVALGGLAVLSLLVAALEVARKSAQTK
jgi:drug/metabolite transporter (DMT)-like permease